MRTRPTPRCRRRYRAALTLCGNANTPRPVGVAPLARFGSAPLLPRPPARITGGRVATPLCAPPAPHWSLRSLAPLRGCPALLARPRRRRRAAALRALPLPRPATTQRHGNDSCQTRATVAPIRADKECAPARRGRQVWPVTSLAFSRPDTAAQPLRYTTSAEAAPLAT